VYIFYWLVIVVTLIYLKWSEGRFAVFGRKSRAGKLRDAKAEERRVSDSTGSSSGVAETPGIEEKKGYGDEGVTRRDLPVLTLEG
jgi:high-affinity iron transporter